MPKFIVTVSESAAKLIRHAEDVGNSLFIGEYADQFVVDEIEEVQLCRRRQVCRR